MMPLSKTEAKIINYLYTQSQELYAAEIARKLNVKKRTIYEPLDSLKQKGIVEEKVRGQMKFYKLTDKWREVAEAAKLVTETDEAPLLSIFRMKIRSLMNRELEILEQIGKERISPSEWSRRMVGIKKEETNLDKEFEGRKRELQKEIGVVVEIPHIAAFRGLESFEDLVARTSHKELEKFAEDVESLLSRISSLKETRDKLKLAITGTTRLRKEGLIDKNKYKVRKSRYETKLRIIEDFLEKVKDLV